MSFNCASCHLSLNFFPNLLLDDLIWPYSNISNILSVMHKCKAEQVKKINKIEFWTTLTHKSFHCKFYRTLNWEYDIYDKQTLTVDKIVKYNTNLLWQQAQPLNWKKGSNGSSRTLSELKTNKTHKFIFQEASIKFCRNVSKQIFHLCCKMRWKQGY